jgi:hypothetical protein
LIRRVCAAPQDKHGEQIKLRGVGRLFAAPHNVCFWQILLQKAVAGFLGQ